MPFTVAAAALTKIVTWLGCAVDHDRHVELLLQILVLDVEAGEIGAQRAGRGSRS